MVPNTGTYTIIFTILWVIRQNLSFFTPTKYIGTLLDFEENIIMPCKKINAAPLAVKCFKIQEKCIKG